MRKRGTDGSLLGSLPWTLTAVMFALLPHTPYLPIWITATFCLCAAWRYWIERRRAHLPAVWLRGVLALACFLGVLGTYATISGVGPGSALLAVMAALKTLETRKRRDQFVLLFIALFLVMSSLLREQYLWSLPYLLLVLGFIMTAWLRMSAGSSESVRQSFRTSSRLLTYTLPLALAMWLLFPRLSSPFWAVPVDTSSGVTGISDTMSPGDISSLSQSNAVAFRARFKGEIPAPRDRYWRALVLRQFNGRTWSGGEFFGNTRPEALIQVSGEPIDYEVTLEPTRQVWVPTLELPYRWNNLRHAVLRQTYELTRMYPIDQRIRYDVRSFTEFRAAHELSRFARSFYTDVGGDRNPRTLAYARELFAESGNVQTYVRTLLGKFHNEEYFYTLQPPPLGRNPVDQFLFETRRGFCEHYASAFAVMLRAVNIPARVVIGYQGGELNPIGGHIVVRQSDAHAWVELWVEGNGWTRVDPTAAVAPERIELGVADSLFDGIGASWGMAAPSELLHRLQMTWDAVNAKWNDWILGYGPEKQRSFMNWLGMSEPNWRNMMLLLIAIVTALTLLISVVLMRRYREPPADLAVRLYDKFVRATGLERAQGEAPRAFAARALTDSPLADDIVQRTTENYLAARYGPPGSDALQRLQRDVATLRRTAT